MQFSQYVIIILLQKILRLSSKKFLNTGGKNMNVLELKNVCITYQNEEKEAVRHVSFYVPEGKIVAIVGESGSGKSTLIRAVIDLLPIGGRISSGTISFLGRNMNEFTKEEKRKMRGEQISMIFQDAGTYLNPRRKIGSQYLEIIDAHLSLTKEEKKKMAVEMLHRLKLSDPERILRSYPFQLSGGMQQRVAIAMAMSMNPRLLVADEPTSALDVTIQAQVVQEMLNIRDKFGTAIVIVTHNMGVASKMADYIAVMQNGELVEFGTREEIIYEHKHPYTRKLLSVVPELEEMIVDDK